MSRQPPVNLAGVTMAGVTMADNRFAVCAAAVMTTRGGFTPRDAVFDAPAAHGVGLGLLSIWTGGPADAAALRALTPTEASRILRAMVWVPLGGDNFPAGPDVALFAYALEAGPLQALTDLQSALGTETSGTPDAPTLAAARAQDPAALAGIIATAHAAWRNGRCLPPARRVLAAAC